MVHENTYKANILMEALPYIKEFSGETVVIKYGGAAMVDEAIKQAVMQDIALMKLIGMRPIIVHGGGPEINQMLKAVGKESVFKNGLRVTDEETVEIAEMVLAGKVNKSIVQLLENQGISAAGLTGKDGNTMLCEKNMPKGEDIGYVGKIVKVNTELIDTLLMAGFTPVIAPIGTDENAQSYNINADTVASAVATAMGAEKLMFLTDVEGVKDAKGDIIFEITTSSAEELIHVGTINGGMIPKVRACVKAVLEGVNRVHIIDGRVLHSILLEIFTDTGIGTMFKKG